MTAPSAEVRTAVGRGPLVVCSAHFGVRRACCSPCQGSSLRSVGRESKSQRYEEVVTVRQPEKEAAKVSVGLILVLVVVLLAMVGMAVLAYTR